MPGVYDYAAIQQVQQANDIVDVVGEHVSLKKKGRELVGLCPFHEDHKPSLYVNPAKQIYKCFACGAGGDVLKFVQTREGLTFPQAIERLAERAGIQLRRTGFAASRVSEPAERVDPNRLAKANAWAAEFFQRCLSDAEKGQQARDYLAERKISLDSIRTWQLGLAPNTVDALARAAAAVKAPVEILQKAGLLVGPNQDKFVSRLMFTITDVTGRVTAFGGRTLSGAGAKYINSPTTVLFDKSNTLYGLQQARHQIVATGTAIIVEGYTDVIMAHQFGCTNVVATLGTSFTPGHGRTLRRYAKKVVLVFDSDTAGMAAANRALEVCLAQHLDIKLAFVPAGKDPCEFLLTAGKEGFDQIVQEAADVLEFKWAKVQETFNADDTLAGRRAAMEEFLQAIATGLASNSLPVLESGVFISKAAKIIGLTDRELRSELARRAPRASRDEGQRQSEAAKVDWGQGLHAAAQREVLEVLLNEPALFQNAGQDISEDLFDVPVLRQVASVILEVLRSGEDFSMGRLFAQAESIELGECIVELQSVGEQKAEKQSYERRLTDALVVLGRRRLPREDVRTNPPIARLDLSGTAGGRPGRENPHSGGIDF